MSLRTAPLGFAEGTAAASMTGATIAHCFTFTSAEPRGLHGLVARFVRSGFPIRHGCDQVLTTGRYHASRQKMCPAKGGIPYKWKQGKGLYLFSIVVNGFRPYPFP